MSTARIGPNDLKRYLCILNYCVILQNIWICKSGKMALFIQLISTQGHQAPVWWLHHLLLAWCHQQQRWVCSAHPLEQPRWHRDAKMSGVFQPGGLVGEEQQGSTTQLRAPHRHHPRDSFPLLCADKAQTEQCPWSQLSRGLDQELFKPPQL